MNPQLATTPFGRRPATLAQVATQLVAKQRSPTAAADKWSVFRNLCAAKDRLGLSERPLAVLNALISFHPEAILTGPQLTVFPSNAQLSLRAHGMAPATLRRHLTTLVDAGLIIRRDSPNGKRYARKGRDGGHRRRLRLRPLAAHCPGLRIRGAGRSRPGRGARTALHARAHHARPPRHRQDDRGRRR